MAKPYIKRKPKTESKSKMHNKVTEIDGYKFDSKLEAQYYVYLKDLLSKGLIYSFELQPKFVLLEAFTKGNKKYRKMEYIGDFGVYKTEDKSSYYVVDTKGFTTSDFLIKEKLFNYLYKDIPLYVVNYDRQTDQWLDFRELRKLHKKKATEKAKNNSRQKIKDTK